MGSSYITSLALLCLTLLAILHSSQAQNSPQDYLNGHNAARSAVGVGPMTWDANVAAFAQNYAKQRAGDCALKHSGGGGKYGENIAVGSGDFTGAAAVALEPSTTLHLTRSALGVPRPSPLDVRVRIPTRDALQSHHFADRDPTSPELACIWPEVYPSLVIPGTNETLLVVVVIACVVQLFRHDLPSSF
ncbi:hypothetical protein Vadar_002002 [Vaccinium darrowii]|uniref:Uncharacterized protein n=1 Tax=Vaccinium darrowii TaxID=229202 RepID=A0ACB7WWU1_9ERIC|nr:hypothetical protein Vadar_002002 [Vaccinium darrowii]